MPLMAQDSLLITGARTSEVVHTSMSTSPSGLIANLNTATGSAWEYDSASDEYYLHLFAKEQPDLNWEHPPVRAAVHDIIRFWLEKGVDGFRYVSHIDAIEHR